METIALPMSGAALSASEAAELAGRMIEDGGLPMVPQALAMLGAQMPDAASEEQAQIALIGALGLVIGAFADGAAAEAIEALENCPESLATHARDLLLKCFFPDGLVELAELDDAAMLTLALLTAATGGAADALALIGEARRQRPSPGFAVMAERVKAHLMRSADQGFKPKLIIWDLDDTLWRGTLAEGDAVELIAVRADYVRAFNRHGIVSAICSKNDFAAARARLEALGLWDEFVFPRIAFAPKGETVRQLIEDMQLRAANVLFIDDNPHNLQEVAARVPGIHVVDATSADCDLLLGQILEDHRHIQKSRVEDYRILAAKVEERTQSGLSNEAFLRESDIRVVFTRAMDNLAFAERIEDLINRSNQLNYTASRVVPGSMAEHIMEVTQNETHSVFVWDRYGYYGLVGFASIHPYTGLVRHLAFSCRVMHMGIEEAFLDKLENRYGTLNFERLRKPLPRERLDVVREVPFLDPDVRARIMAAEVPRAATDIGLRLMCDCQSGALFHYSRFNAKTEFDNYPRLFSLPMMAGDAWEKQHYPRALVYATGTDYLDWRWTDQGLTAGFTPVLFAECAERFVRFVVENDRRLLLLLAPTDAGDDKYLPAVRCFERARGIACNAVWRALAARHPAHIACIDLNRIADDSDMRDANHFLPPLLSRLAGMVDDWYAAG